MSVIVASPLIAPTWTECPLPSVPCSWSTVTRQSTSFRCPLMPGRFVGSFVSGDGFLMRRETVSVPSANFR